MGPCARILSTHTRGAQTDGGISTLRGMAEGAKGREQWPGLGLWDGARSDALDIYLSREAVAAPRSPCIVGPG